MTCCDPNCPEFTQSLKALSPKKDADKGADIQENCEPVSAETEDYDFIEELEKIFGSGSDTTHKDSDFIIIPKDEYYALKESLCQIQSTLYDICDILDM